jgi:hypothetical protein
MLPPSKTTAIQTYAIKIDPKYSHLFQTALSSTRWTPDLDVDLCLAPSYEASSAPLWKLTHLFQALMFCPHCEK